MFYHNYMVAHSFNCFYLHLPPLTFITAFYFYIKFSFLYQISFFSTKESNKLVGWCFSVNFTESIFILQWDEQVIKSETKKIILFADKFNERKDWIMYKLLLKLMVKYALKCMVKYVVRSIMKHIFKNIHIVLISYIHIGILHLIIIKVF